MRTAFKFWYDDHRTNCWRKGEGGEGDRDRDRETETDGGGGGGECMNAAMHASLRKLSLIPSVMKTTCPHGNGTGGGRGDVE